MTRGHSDEPQHRPNHGDDGEPVESVGLLVTIDADLAEISHRLLTMVARAAQALDELRRELASADRVIVEQQVRLGQLYKLFPDPDAGLG